MMTRLGSGKKKPNRHRRRLSRLVRTDLREQYGVHEQPEVTAAPVTME